MSQFQPFGTKPFSLPFEIMDVLRGELALPDLNLNLSADWGSLQDGHREKIRIFLYENIEEQKAVMDLTKPPRLSVGDVSISHNRQIGGIANSTRVRALGFDIEEADRLNLKNLARFSHESERAKSPSASALWTAKEAAFKALKGPQQPSVIGQIEIGHWQKVGKFFHKFKISSVESPGEFQTARGITFPWDHSGVHFTLALMVRP